MSAASKLTTSDRLKYVSLSITNHFFSLYLSDIENDTVSVITSRMSHYFNDSHLALHMS